MSSDINPHTNPVQTYLEIEENLLNGEGSYPVVAMAKDLARLMVSCKALIQQNALLSARTASAETLVEEQTVEIFTKDIEIQQQKEEIRALLHSAYESGNIAE
jgi:predicted secreted acid phosphatase